MFEGGNFGEAEALRTSTLQSRIVKKDSGFDYEYLRRRNLLFAVVQNQFVRLTYILHY
jgi:hypothetical protein